MNAWPDFSASADPGLTVKLSLELGLAQQITMSECVSVLSEFGEVSVVDMTSCRTNGSVAVRYFEKAAAEKLRDHLTRRRSMFRLQEPPPARLEDTPEEQNFEIDELRIASGEEKRRTVMVGQIPRSCDAVSLLEAMRSIGLIYRLVFFYMPMDKARKRHCGYAFLEFLEAIDVLSLHQSMQHLGLTVGRLPSERPMHMHFARIQGWRTFMKSMTDMNFIFEPNANYRPQLFFSAFAERDSGARLGPAGKGVARPTIWL